LLLALQQAGAAIDSAIVEAVRESLPAPARSKSG